MECLNCKKDLKHTPGKRKKQFCNPNCRVTYWQKNKPKKEKIVDPLSDLIEVRKEQDTFCIKRGWNVPDLLGKIEEFEKRVKYLAESKFEVEQQLGELIANSSHITFKKDMTPHEILEEYGVEAYNQAIAATKKPNTALKDKKATHIPKKEDKGGKGAKNSAVNYANPYKQDSYDAPPLERVQDEPDWQKGVKEAGIDEQPPEGLSEIQLMVWKNDQKRKNNPKAAPITGFGLTKKEKK